MTGHGFEGNIETFHPFLSHVLLLTYQEVSNLLLNVLCHDVVPYHWLKNNVNNQLWPDTMSSHKLFPLSMCLFQVFYLVAAHWHGIF